MAAILARHQAGDYDAVPGYNHEPARTCSPRSASWIYRGRSYFELLVAARPTGAVTTLFRMRRLRGRSGWSASLGQWTRTALSAVFRLRTHRISLNPPMSFPIIDRAAITSIFESSVPTRPSWSPQGRYLVYSVARPNVAANQIVSDIWLLDTEHCASERIISGISGSDPAITWAPDGTRLSLIHI